ncbi:MAG: ATP-binding protein [Dehalococcoidia bacterium]
MNGDDVKHLLERGETLEVEFKSDRSNLSDDALVEAAVCMANASGGLVFVGVEDDGTVTGVGGGRPRSADGVAAMIRGRSDPPIETSVQFVPVGEYSILVIRVPSARSIATTTSGKCLRRQFDARGRPQCVPFPASQHTSRLGDLGLVDYSAHKLPECGIEHVDAAAMASLRMRAREAKPSVGDLPDDQLLAALGLLAWEDAERRCLNVAGLVCVGKEAAIRRWLPTHEVSFQVIDEYERVSVNHFSNAPILVALDDIERRFDARNQELELAIGLAHIRIPDYPKESFREALVNALAHRDYARLGTVRMEMAPDRMSISNPGGFPSGITLDNFLVHEPKPRNQTLATALLQLGLAERSGLGIDRIFSTQLRWGRPAPDYSATDSDACRLVLAGGRPSLEIVRAYIREEQEGRQLRLDDLLILNHLLRYERLDAAVAARLTQKDDRNARAALGRLESLGYISPIGRRRPEYELSRAFLDVVNTRPARARRSERFDEGQLIAMVGRHVLAYESITRSEAAGLCRLAPDEAKALLRRMRDDALLVLEGVRRTSKYREGPGLRSAIASLDRIPKKRQTVPQSRPPS